MRPSGYGDVDGCTNVPDTVANATAKPIVWWFPATVTPCGAASAGATTGVGPLAATGATNHEPPESASEYVPSGAIGAVGPPQVALQPKFGQASTTTAPGGGADPDRDTVPSTTPAVSWKLVPVFPTTSMTPPLTFTRR